MPSSQWIRNRWAVVAVPLVALACGSLLGCGGGTKLNRVSGRVTFNGQPVPAGKIYFTPDAAKGNSGPAGFADIKDGAYDTSAAGGQGVAPGPVAVRIEGTDGSKALFVGYQTSVELPQGSSTQDFEVPSSAAKNLPKDAGPPP